MKQLSLNYCEFDLSKISDTKAGYFEPSERPEPPPQDRIDGECIECSSTLININYFKHFRLKVCDECISRLPEKYSLLTKTECKLDYLLTDGELKDSTLLPHWVKPNPHKQSYSNMLLYCRSQVEAFGFKKWGGESGLDNEIERRKEETLRRKRKKFKRDTIELRRKTMTKDSNLIRDDDHKHQFGDPWDTGGGLKKQECKTCKFQVEFEEF